MAHAPTAVAAPSARAAFGGQVGGGVRALPPAQPLLVAIDANAHDGEDEEGTHEAYLQEHVLEFALRDIAKHDGCLAPTWRARRRAAEKQGPEGRRMGRIIASPYFHPVPGSAAVRGEH